MTQRHSPGYLADEYFAFDLGSNDIRTKRRFIEEIKEAAAANTSTIADNRLPRPEDPIALRKNETLVIGDNTAVQVLTGGRIGDVPVRLQIVVDL